MARRTCTADVPAVELRPVPTLPHHQQHLPRPAGRQHRAAHILGEPARQSRRRWRSWASSWSRSTPWARPCARCRFHAYYYGDLGDNGLPDQIAVMRQLAERHPWIDLSRVGIYGHSGGGFATAAAQCCSTPTSSTWASPAPATWTTVATRTTGARSGTASWSRRRTARTRTRTRPCSCLAANLRGRLLLAYGTMDNNVHPNMTLLLINELIRQNKDFDTSSCRTGRTASQ
jgi:hypothetical protein